MLRLNLKQTLICGTLDLKVKTMGIWMQKSNRVSCPQVLRNDFGFVLGTTLLVLIVLALFMVAGVQWASQDIPRTAKYKKSRQAFYIADAGIQQAINFLNYNALGSGNGFNDELNGANWPVAFASTPVGTGAFAVTIADNDPATPTVDSDNTVVLNSVGTTNGISSTIQATIFRPLFNPGGAVVTQGNLTINGNPNIQGTNGSVHTNSDLDIAGAPNIAATATGSYTAAGSQPGITGPTGGGLPPVDIPTINPLDFKIFADYVLKADGTVEDGAGNLLHDTGTNGKWDDWDFKNGDTWELGGGNTQNGMFYAEGNIDIKGNPGEGDPGTPAWQATLIATKNVELSGNPVIDNYNDPNDPQAINNLLFIAGLDLRISGNPNQTFTGIMYAGEQMNLDGDPNVNGYILSKDLSANSNLATGNSINGNPSITYNGGLAPPPLSWQYGQDFSLARIIILHYLH